MSGIPIKPARALPRWGPPVLIALATVLAFAPVLGHSFTDWDDPSTVADNRDFNPPRWAALLRYWTRPHMDLYAPVTYTAWAALAAVAFDAQSDAAGQRRLDPRVFHAANLAIHVLAALAAYALLVRLLRRESDATSDEARPQWSACAGAMLFALHPVQVEAVAWVSGLKDVLSGLLALLAVLLYVRHAQPVQTGRWAFPAATACYALAMFAKPAAVATPLVALAIDALVLRRPWRAIARPVGLWLALAVPVIAIGAAVQPAAHVPRVAAHVRPLVALDALAFYARHVAWPHPLGIDYGRAPDRIWDGVATYVLWFVPLAVAALAWIGRRRHPWFAAAAAVFAAALLPVLGLVPFDFQRYSTVADHYLYVAMLGPALLLAYAASRGPRVAPLVVIAVTVVCGAVTVQQARHWRDSATLFARALATNPQSLAGLRGQANLAMKRGDARGAAALLDRALSVRPADGDTHGAIGNLLLRHLDRPADAVAHYERAAAARPHSGSIRALIGAAHQRANNPAAAVEAYEAALRLDPRQFEARVNLARLLADAGDDHRALAHLDAAAKLDPFHPAVRQASQRIRARASPATRAAGTPQDAPASAPTFRP